MPVGMVGGGVEGPLVTKLVHFLNYRHLLSALANS